MDSTTAEKIAVMQAYERGETIRWSLRHCTEWTPMSKKDNEEPRWNWEVKIYEIMPKPRIFSVYGDEHGPSLNTNGWKIKRGERIKLIEVLAEGITQ